jgi:hypothetical protein
MKKHLQNSICLCRQALSRQSTSDVIVAVDPTAFIGIVGLLAPLYR